MTAILLRAEGAFMNRKRVQTLMRLMGIAALAGHSSRARLSLSRRGHRLGVESAPCVVGRA
jgi:hypothetical protein